MTGATSGSWSDLRARVITGVLLAFVGLAAVVLGGGVLLIALAAALTAMIWELARMMAPGRENQAYLLGAMAGAGLLIFGAISPYIGGGLLLAVPIIGAFQKGRVDGALFLFYGLMIVAGTLGLYLGRVYIGLAPVLLLVLIVVVTDIAGYFGGRLIGGPKFWPAISPKKTWSGTIAGWVGAVAVTMLVIAVFGQGTMPIRAFVMLAVVLSFASQMGDIAESALKRRAGIKDSSNILPGHGGVLDRFDGMIAVFAVAMALWCFLYLFGGYA